MPQTLRDVMTPDPKVLPKTATVKEAADLMRDDDIGDVIVVNAHKKLFGIITDRDIAMRVVTEGGDPTQVRLEDVATKDVTTLGPDATVEQAVKTMREQAIRRLPIVDDGKPIGVVSLGDLAIERDPTSALADISAAPPDAAEPSANGTRSAGGLGKNLPAVAAGAGLALTFDYLRNRGRKRSVKVAAKRLRKTGKKLRRSGDKTASEATAQAAKYATIAAGAVRGQSKKMRKKAEAGGERLEDRTQDLSKRAQRKSKDLGNRADRKSEDLSKRAQHKSEDLSKRAQHKSKDLSKRAQRKSQELSKRAEARAKELSKLAEGKTKDLGKLAEGKSKDLRRQAKKVGKLAERKAEEVRELVAAGKH